MKLEIEITTEDLINQVAARILGMYAAEYDEDGEPVPERRGREPLAQIIEKTVIKRVQRAVDEQIKAVTAEKIGTAVDDVLVAGWQTTNSYGEPSGPRVTLRDRVSKIITEAQDGGWNGQRKTLIDAIVERKLAELFDHRNGAIGKAIEEAQAKLRSAIDGTVMTALATTLRQALGLR